MSTTQPKEQLTAKVCECLHIFPEEVEHHLPVNIGKSEVESLVELIHQHTKAEVQQASNLILNSVALVKPLTDGQYYAATSAIASLESQKKKG